jgi:hypothetical protein
MGWWGYVVGESVRGVLSLLVVPRELGTKVVQTLSNVAVAIAAVAVAVAARVVSMSILLDPRRLAIANRH